jgi:predicted ester cyclase
MFRLQTSETLEMSTENNIAIVRRVIEEGLSQHNLALINEFFDPEFVENQFGIKPTISGMQESFESLYRAFPDYRLVINDLIAKGDKVWLRMTCTGTNTGGFMGHANGKAFQITVMDVVRLKDGKIVEHWGVPDRFHLLIQLGILKVPLELVFKES